MSVIFITGIDTGIGKTYATGLMGRYLRRSGSTVITQKIVQTGCVERSEDIATHRMIMGMDMTDDDLRGTTCPYVFPVPASPHLAARSAHAVIDLEKISTATDDLAKRFDYVLLEGVGGIMVPLIGNKTLLDYISQRGYPVVIVSSPRLGSINHTLMTIELLRTNGLTIKGIIYNKYDEKNNEIAADSKIVFASFLSRCGLPSVIVDMPAFKIASPPMIDFSALLN